MSVCLGEFHQILRRQIDKNKLISLTSSKAGTLQDQVVLATTKAANIVKENEKELKNIEQKNSLKIGSSSNDVKVQEQKNRSDSK